MKYLFAIFLILFVHNNCFSQQQNIYIGTTQVNLDYDRDGVSGYKLDSANPDIALFHFAKIGQEWKVIDEIDSFYTNYYRLNNFGIFYRGKKLSSNSAFIDTSMITVPYFEYPYRLESTKLPRIGKKNMEFAGEFGFKYFRPLLFSNCLNCKRVNNIRYRKPADSDKIQVNNFLIFEAQKLSLGDIRADKELIDEVTNVLFINDSCKIIVANVNLNMYCYTQKIPFDSTETTVGQIWNTEESLAISYFKKTKNCYFLFNKNEAHYIGHSMHLLDYADFDNDGYDEIIFRNDIGDNYAGYVLVTNRLKETFESGWRFH